MTTAIILAGGLGTRLRSVVQDVPKPMAPVNGKPFLEHLIDYWMRQGVDTFVLSVGYKHEIITEYFGSAYKGAKIDYAIEEQPHGTGGGLLLAKTKTSGQAPLLLLNGDTYFAVELDDLFNFYTSHHADWCFSLFRTSDKGRYMGMDVEADGRIASLHSASNDETRLANGGVYLVNPDAVDCGSFKAGDDFSLENDGFPAAIKNGQRFYGIELSADFIDIGVPDDYARVQNMLDTR